ncbi:emp24p/erv25p- protein [Zygosaccharomyces mellis]|uniref:Emp24p/erv25p-protein n=1 Tax=Zygosaccharomyces mellis TaxID=42258 RepID=A0A4C2E6P7_9SACH|nr:emp24p/erv25p- protein [Zygosaccharomyces mellis]
MSLFSTLLKLAIVALLFPSQIAAFYFYSNGERRCFHKELSKDTLLQGKYSVKVYDDGIQSYRDTNPQEFDVSLEAEEVFDDYHRVMHRRGVSGELSLLALDSGEHRICIQAQPNSWMGQTKTKINLDFEIDSDVKLDSKQKTVVDSLHQKINILNDKVLAIRREQKLVREREAQFRDISESVNSHAMWWSVFQLVVLVLTCIWQMRHLRTFFVKQKVL